MVPRIPFFIPTLSIKREVVNFKILNQRGGRACPSFWGFLSSYLCSFVLGRPPALLRAYSWQSSEYHMLFRGLNPDKLHANPLYDLSSSPVTFFFFNFWQEPQVSAHNRKLSGRECQCPKRTQEKSAFGLASDGRKRRLDFASLRTICCCVHKPRIPLWDFETGQFCLLQ